MEFAQEAITTLHDLDGADPSVHLEEVAVVVPIMAEDLPDPAVDHVLSSLGSLDPGRIVLCVRASRDDVIELRRELDDRRIDVDLVWCNAPALQSRLANAGITFSTGKGRDVWLGMAVAAERHPVVVVHDADTRSYSPDLVRRLAWPLEHGYDFSKGYYARVENERLYGRLVRLVWMPLLEVIGRGHSEPFIDYLRAFRYPLAGEFAISADLVHRLSMAPGWGLETDLLGEMYEHVGSAGTAQVDLGVHEHDHRPVSGDRGLESMAQAVAGTLYRNLELHGIEIEPTRLARAYADVAETYLDQYEADAAFNGLQYDRKAERSQVRTYRDAIASPTRSDERLPPFDSVDLAAKEIMEAGGIQPAETRRSP